MAPGVRHQSGVKAPLRALRAGADRSDGGFPAPVGSRVREAAPGSAESLSPPPSPARGAFVLFPFEILRKFELLQSGPGSQDGEQAPAPGPGKPPGCRGLGARRGGVRGRTSAGGPPRPARASQPGPQRGEGEGPPAPSSCHHTTVAGWGHGPPRGIRSNGGPESTAAGAPWAIAFPSAALTFRSISATACCSSRLSARSCAASTCACKPATLFSSSAAFTFRSVSATACCSSLALDGTTRSSADPPMTATFLALGGARH